MLLLWFTEKYFRGLLMICGHGRAYTANETVMKESEIRQIVGFQLALKLEYTNCP